jgi:hypothetical protein
MFNLPIPNLLNGISQQPPPVRFPTQAERQVNAYSSPVEGLTKRPPTEHVAKMADDDDPGYDVGSLGYKFHLIDRGDGAESYAVLVRKAPSSSCTSCVKIYDLKNDGAEVPVLYAGTAADYLVGTPETGYQDLELVSIADYTFIVNRAKAVAMDNTTSATNTSEGAIIWVAGAGYGQTYTISLKLEAGSEVTVSYTTSDTSFHNQPVTVDFQTFPDKSSTIDSSYIAANLRVALLANPTILGSYDITRDGFALYIKPKTAGAAFTAKVTDGESGNDLRISKDAVNRFEDLPIRAPHNFVMKVAGLPEEDRDDYYVKFVQTGADTTKPGPGEWEETVAPGVLTTIDAKTMPHGLIRYFDGGGNAFFVFKAFDGVSYGTPSPLEGSDISWGTRQVGDTQTNPLPSFVGQTISDIFIFKNRLGFLSGEYVILSESGEYFNFFRTTVTALLDSEVIDVGSAYPGITLFHSAVPYLDRLILFADRVQMAIQASNGPLSPKTVTLSVVSNYDYLRSASPAPVNDLIFFPFSRGGFSGVRNMQVSQDDSNILTAVDISAHVPQYIDGPIIYMAASAHENLLVTLTETDPTKLYVYKWFDNERSRVQSSWSEWIFEDGEVIGFAWEGTALWIAFRRPEGIYLERMFVEPDRRDANSEFVVRMDRRASVVPSLETTPQGEATLWAEFPYVADQTGFGGGNFAEFSVTDVSYQAEFDKQPVKTDPGGEIFATVATIEQGSQSYTGFSGDINLPSTSSAAYFHARLAFTLEPGGSASFTLPLLGIDPNTGYVNLEGRTNSLKTYIYIRTPGGVRTYRSYSGKILINGTIVGGMTGGWDMVETAGQFNGNASFTNSGDEPVTVEFIFEKAVDLIPDVLIYDDSDTLLHTLRPGVADPPLYEEQLGYRLGNSLFRTSSLNRDALLAFTPDPLDPLVTYAGDQNTAATLPPHYVLNKRCFFAVQNGGRISLGIYTNDAQTFGDLSFSGPPARLPLPDGTPLSGTYYSNYELGAPPLIDRNFTTPDNDGYFFFHGLGAGQEVHLSFDSLDGASGPFRWLSFARLDKTVLGYGEPQYVTYIPFGFLPAYNYPDHPIALRKGPLNLSTGMADALDRAFSPIVDAAGDEVSIIALYGYDETTLEEWSGFAIRIRAGSTAAQKIIRIQGEARWGDMCSDYLSTFPVAVGTPAPWAEAVTAGDPYTWNWPSALVFDARTIVGGTFPPTSTGLPGPGQGPIVDVADSNWYGFFAKGPSVYQGEETPSYSNVPLWSSLYLPEMEITTTAGTTGDPGTHDGYWPNVNFYRMTFDSTTGEWRPAARWTQPAPDFPVYPNSEITADPPVTVVEGVSYYIDNFARAYELSSGRCVNEIRYSEDMRLREAASSGDQIPVYPAWWATQGTNTVDDRTGVIAHTAIIASGVSSIPVTMSSWASSGTGIIPSTSAISFPYGVLYQSGTSGAGLGDAGLTVPIYYDSAGFPEVEATATGTRVRLEYPLEGTRFDVDGVQVWVGVPYTMEYEFSTPYLRQNDTTVTTGRMQVRNMAVEYDKAGYFEVEVYDRETGITRIYEKDLTLGYTHSRYPADAGIDTPNLTDGSFKFPVMIRNTNARIILRNSSAVPARFLSAEIEASYDSRARRI